MIVKMCRRKIYVPKPLRNSFYLLVNKLHCLLSHFVNNADIETKKTVYFMTQKASNAGFQIEKIRLFCEKKIS